MPQKTGTYSQKNEGTFPQFTYSFFPYDCFFFSTVRMIAIPNDPHLASQAIQERENNQHSQNITAKL